MTELDTIPYARVDTPPQGRWTVADWERLPEDGARYEVVEGVLCMTTAPSNFHQWIVLALVQHVGLPAQQQGLGYCFVAPVGVVASPITALQPDFLFILKQYAGMIRGGRIRGAPDLVVEVRSPGNTDAEMRQKQHSYANLGVPEYAVVDPARRTLRYYRLEAGIYAEAQVFSVGDTLAFAGLPSLPLAVSALFDGAPDTSIEIDVGGGDAKGGPPYVAPSRRHAYILAVPLTYASRRSTPW